MQYDARLQQNASCVGLFPCFKRVGGVEGMFFVNQIHYTTHSIFRTLLYLCIQYLYTSTTKLIYGFIQIEQVYLLMIYVGVELLLQVTSRIRLGHALPRSIPQNAVIPKGNSILPKQK